MAGAMVEGWQRAGVDFSEGDSDPAERQAGAGSSHCEHHMPA